MSGMDPPPDNAEKKPAETTDHGRRAGWTRFAGVLWIASGLFILVLTLACDLPTRLVEGILSPEKLAGGTNPCKAFGLFHINAFTRNTLVASGLALISFAFLPLIRIPLRRPASRPASWNRGTPALIFLVSMAALMAVSALVFQGTPMATDEQVYRFQAKVFAAGSLYAEAHPLQAFFESAYLVHHDGKLFSLFCPGWPLLLAAGELTGMPWLINPLISSFTLVLVFLIGVRIFDRATALLACALMLSSAYFLFNGTSLFSHATSLFAITLSTWLLLVGLERMGNPWFFLSGFAMGFCFFTRYLDVVYAAPFLWFFLPRKENGGAGKTLPACASFAAGFLAWVLVILLFNRALTGDPFLLPYKAYLTNPSYIGGFKYVEGKPLISLSYAGVGAMHTFFRLLFINAWFIPGILLFIAAVLFGKKSTWERILILAVVCVCGLYVFYGMFGGLQYGPRYYYILCGTLSLLAAKGVTRVHQGLGGKGGSGLSRSILTHFLILALFLNFAMVIGYGQLGRNLAGNVTDLEDKVEEAGIDRAIIFVDILDQNDDWESTLVSNLPDFSNPVLIARDRGDENRLIREFYPDLPAYRYEADSIYHIVCGADGRLTPLETGGVD